MFKSAFLKFQIWMMKRRMRHLYLKLIEIVNSHDCGHSLLSSISSTYRSTQKEYYEVKHWLQQNDPTFPKDI